MSDKSSCFFLHACTSDVPTSQATFFANSGRISIGSTSSTHAKTKYDAIRSVFKTPEHSRLTRTKHTYPFPSDPTQIPKTTSSSPKNTASHHDGTGSAKSTVNMRPNSAYFTDPFTRSLPVGNTDEKGTSDEHNPKGKGSDLTQFTALQLPTPACNALADYLTQMERTRLLPSLPSPTNSSSRLVNWSLV